MPARSETKITQCLPVCQQRGMPGPPGMGVAVVRVPYLGNTDRKVGPGSGPGLFPLDPGYRWKCLWHVRDACS